MSELAQFLSSRWPEVIIFLLVLGRTSGLVISAPFWGRKTVPGLARIVVAVSLGVAVYPLAKPVLSSVEGLAEGLAERPVLSAAAGTASLPSLISLLMALGGEVLLGLILGWAAQLLFAGVRLAGHVIESKMGLSLAQLVDPQEGGQTGVLAVLLDTSIALVFFALNGHLLLIQALAASYNLFPLAGEKPVLSGVEAMVASAGEIFTIALRISAPVVVALFFSNIVLGIVSRAIPQMNVFIVALPLQLAFGMLLFLLSLPVLVWFFANQLSAIGNQLLAISPVQN